MIWWAKHRSLDQATAWLEGIEQALASLGENPERYALAAESSAFPFPLRQLNFGLGSQPTHRVLFEVRTDRVIVDAVRHVLQQPVTPETLSEP